MYLLNRGYTVPAIAFMVLVTRVRIRENAKCDTVSHEKESFSEVIDLVGAGKYGPGTKGYWSRHYYHSTGRVAALSH
jgi:hypothetical protein